MTKDFLTRLLKLLSPAAQLTLQSLLARGYLPKELPPPFTTSAFATAVTTKGKTLPPPFSGKKDKWCGFVSFSLARPGALRRRLTISNPLAHYRLAAVVVKNQDRLFKLASPGVVCLSYPRIVGAGKRAITTHSKLSDLPGARAKNRVGKRFVLRTDVSNFYPSIYTHTLDWAITGKAKAKANFSKSVKRLGKRVDSLVTASQGGQTRGLPIGPDTSLLLAHVLLAPVDKALRTAGLAQGFRFMDDYELVFENRGQAEKALAVLMTALAKFELDLNSLKTRIEEVPTDIDNSPILELKSMRLAGEGGTDKYDLIAFFNRAFNLSKKYPEMAILRYATGRLNKSKWTSEARLVQDLVLQCVLAEPGVWLQALPLLLRLHDSTKLATEAIKEVIDITIRQQAPQGHSSEVAWSLWAAIVFELPLAKNSVTQIIKMEDDVCMLLLLHARELDLVAIDATGLKRIKSLVVREQLYGEHWLLAYEATSKQWIKPHGGNFLVKDEVFKFLYDQKVEFYEVSAAVEARKAFKVPETEEDMYGVGNEIIDLLDET